MKITRNQNYRRIMIYVICSAIVVGIFAMFCYNFDSFTAALKSFFEIIKPILYGFMFAFLLYPLLKFIETRIITFKKSKKKHPLLRRALSILICYIVALAVIVAFFAIVVPQVVSSYRDFTSRASDYLDSAQKWVDSVLKDSALRELVIDIQPTAPSEFDPDAEYTFYRDTALTLDRAQASEMHIRLAQIRSEAISIDLSEMIGDLLDKSYNLLSAAAPYILNYLGALLTEVKNVLLGLILSVYFLATREQLVAQFKKGEAALLSEKAREKLDSFGKMTYSTFIEFLIGKLLDALVIGILCFIAMSFMKLPYAPLISVLVGITNIIPYIGPFLGAVPGAFIIFIIKPIDAVWFVLMIIALQQLDSNLIEPRILGNRTGLPPVIVMSAVIIMGGILGITGLLIGVPTAAVIYETVRRWAHQRLSAKGQPVATDDYMSVNQRYMS